VDAWRGWYSGDLGSHIEFETSEGEIGRNAIANTYMPDYGKQYYAKHKDFDGMTTVMPTFTTSHRNVEGARWTT